MKKFLKRIWPALKGILWTLGCAWALFTLVKYNLFWHVAAVAGILTSASVAMGLYQVSRTMGGLYCVDCGTCMVRAKEPEEAGPR